MFKFFPRIPFTYSVKPAIKDRDPRLEILTTRKEALRIIEEARKARKCST